MATVPSPVERKVVLNVSWEAYERLLAEHPDAAGPRFTYNEGMLEIVVLSARHEQPNRTLAMLVEVLAEEFGLDFCHLGSTTFKRADLFKGFEPDSAFYLSHGSRAAQFLEDSRNTRSTEWLRRVREWAREQKLQGAGC